ncbi:MAG: hypothetical protein HY459_04655 [Parcubacteria group bacterium]|nr:hypothetical protein [Parcubacteria group bacterium]
MNTDTETRNDLLSDQVKLPENEKLFRLSEISRRSQYSQEYLSLLVRKGKLTATKIDRSWHTSIEEVSRYELSQKARLRNELGLNANIDSPEPLNPISPREKEQILPSQQVSSLTPLEDHQKSLGSVTTPLVLDGNITVPPEDPPLKKAEYPKKGYRHIAPIVLLTVGLFIVGVLFFLFSTRESFKPSTFANLPHHTALTEPNAFILERPNGESLAVGQILLDEWMKVYAQTKSLPATLYLLEQNPFTVAEPFELYQLSFRNRSGRFVTDAARLTIHDGQGDVRIFGADNLIATLLVDGELMAIR